MKINAVLLIFNHSIGESAPTIYQHINSFVKYSKQKIYSVNTEYNFPNQLNDFRFKIIIFHYSIFNRDNYYLDKRLLKYLENDQDSYRIAFFQDEHQFCKARFNFINNFRIRLIYSLLEESEYEKVYYKYTNVDKVIFTLTGYVDNELISLSRKFYKPISQREIDISYRARRLNFFMGAGAQEKTNIALMFLERLRIKKNIELKTDIKIGDSERFNGNDWYRFLSNSKAVLGVEAGVSIFDLEDKVRLACNGLESKYRYLDFKEVSDKILFEWEDNIYYRTISPRIFEAAAMRCVQILFEGKYSDILIPYKHYIPLKKDFSNFEEVISSLADEKYVISIINECYNDLIISERYSYKKFILDFDKDCDLINSSGFHVFELDEIFSTIDRRNLIFDRLRSIFTGLRFPGKNFVKKIFLNHS